MRYPRKFNYLNGEMSSGKNFLRVRQICGYGFEIPRQQISIIEHGRRFISLKMARRHSLLPGVPIEIFLETHEEWSEFRGKVCNCGNYRNRSSTPAILSKR